MSAGTTNTPSTLPNGLADAAELQAADATTSDWTAAFACRDATAVPFGIDEAIYAADNAAREAGDQLASEDAGCSDAAILHYLRRPGCHRPGCWVVGLLVGVRPGKRRSSW